MKKFKGSGKVKQSGYFFLLLLISLSVVWLPGCGKSDDGGGGKLETWYEDADKDRYGNPEVKMESASQPDGYVSNNADCNDSSNAIHPRATDLPDSGVDENCSGLPMVTWYQDKDRDGYGVDDPESNRIQETKPQMIYAEDLDDNIDYVAVKGDCYDWNPYAHPGIGDEKDDKYNDVFFNNGYDNDCDGLLYTNWYPDNDGDGAGDASSSDFIISEGTPDDDNLEYAPDNRDCDDSNGLINPLVPETLNDDIDNNCNGKTDEYGSIPDTGIQDIKSLGDDATYRHNQQSYEILDSTRVKDKVTGLIWEIKTEKNSSPDSENPHDADNLYTYNELAENFLGKLNENLTDDDPKWRLPTAKELQYLLNLGKNDNQAIDTNFFPDTNFNTSYWTSTDSPGEPGKKIVVNFKQGNVSSVSIEDVEPGEEEIYIHGEKVSVSSVSTEDVEPAYQLCAMALYGNSNNNTSGLPQFDGITFTDISSGLMWQVVPAPLVKEEGKEEGKEEETGRTWNDALDYCENLELAGYSDWRLPNKNELLSLLNYEKENPPYTDDWVTHNTQDGINNSYWSSSIEVYSIRIGMFWSINFDNATVAVESGEETYQVRAVRSYNVKIWYEDIDGDGYGNFEKAKTAISQPDDYVEIKSDADKDCNDDAFGINPGEIDVPDNGVDEDCSGGDLLTWHKDSDNDGFGDKWSSVTSDIKPAEGNFVSDGSDCDDSEFDVNPGVEDEKNDPLLLDDGFDNDCDGDEFVTWSPDYDKDGFGTDSSDSTLRRTSEGPPQEDPEHPGLSFVANASDCVDDNNLINPGVVEVLNDGIDNNCNTEIDEYGSIPDTGIVISRVNNDDAAYLINPQSYEIIAPTMVQDNVTGLIWEIKTDIDNSPHMENLHDADNLYSYNDLTENFIGKLNETSFGGHSSWRIPTAKELQYLLNLGKNQNRAIDTNFFPDTNFSTSYWTSTDSPAEPGKKIVVNFAKGIVSSQYLSEQLCAMAVCTASDASSQELIVNMNKTVMDTATGLMWQQIPEQGETGRTWNDALVYCENLELAGHSDWRLPNKNELISLLRFEKESSPYIDEILIDNTQYSLNNSYWSSSHDVYSRWIYDYLNAWSVNFDDGTVGSTGIELALQVRAVRGGNVFAETWYYDGDNDTYGNFEITKTAVIKPDNYVKIESDADKDCDDTSDLIYPGAEEIIGNGIDEDCSGGDLLTLYRDGDSDGFGDSSSSILADSDPGYVKDNSDCDDSDPDVHPRPDEPENSLAEADDGKDNDCNGSELVTWYEDFDGDGYGDQNVSLLSENSEEEGYIQDRNGFFDCNDNDNSILPGIVEDYTEDIDRNCNGENYDASLQIIPDTWQTSSYTAIEGEDSDYQSNPPSLSKLILDNETLVEDNSAENWLAVKDNVTGLIWEAKTQENKGALYTFAEAEAYCESLNEGEGYANNTDWRIPTVTELSYIANCDSNNPAISIDYFPRTEPVRYWSSTPVPDNSGQMMTISFVHSASDNNNKTDQYSVRAVRGSQTELTQSRYIDNNDGTIFDTKTGLMWQKAIGGGGNPLSWENALTYCNNLELPDATKYIDWRLPSKNELLSIIDIDESSPFNNHDVFLYPEGDNPDRVFWTSTTALVSTDPPEHLWAWMLNFSLESSETSIIAIGAYNDARYVRAVRGGNINP